MVTRALEIARELCALPREPMLRTRALARQDLHALFGTPDHAARAEGEFGRVGRGHVVRPGDAGAPARGVHQETLTDAAYFDG